MLSEWQTMSLREAGVSLIDCDHRTPPAAKSGYPYVAIPQLKQGRIDLADVRRITREHFLEWTLKAKPKPYDVVLSRRCNPGETAFVPSGLEFALGQNLVLLRADGRKVFPPFLRWLVRGPLWWEQVGTFLNVGAVFDSLKCSDIPNFLLTIPPYHEQEAIATVLGEFDDKIELNRRVNVTLEEMAQALFKSWFVDFDPVRARAEGRQPYGMDADTAALFPDVFEDSYFDEIPLGWNISTLGEVIELFDSKRIPLSANERAKRHGSYPYYGASGIIDRIDDYLFDGRFLLISEDGENLNSRRTPIAFLANGKFWVNNHAHVIRGANGVSTEHILLFIDQADISGYITGAVQPKLSQDSLRIIPFTLPPQKICQRFQHIVTPLFSKIIANNCQNETLTETRDTLLPKLLSGNLCVKETSKEFAEVI